MQQLRIIALTLLLAGTAAILSAFGSAGARGRDRHAFDFDIDGVILNLWGNRPELMARAEEHLAPEIAHHPGILVKAGFYLRSGMDGGRWLSEEELKRVLTHYVDMINKGKPAGLRIFSTGHLDECPGYSE